MTTCYHTIDDLIKRPDIVGLRILLRVDLNVPIEIQETKNVIRDTTRLECLLPMLQELSEAGARIALLSHFGRPSHHENNTKMSLYPLVDALSHLLSKKIAFSEDCIGDIPMKVMEQLNNGEIALFENTRFHASEYNNNKEFSKKMAELGDIYINDAFSVAHRTHASTEGIAHILPAYIGRTMKKELDTLTTILKNPQRPLMGVIGGSKISTKMPQLIPLVNHVDTLVIGGAMANTFLKAHGYEIGHSLCEDDVLNTVKEFMDIAKQENCQILLPQDVIIGDKIQSCDNPLTVSIDAIPHDKMILDAGALSIDAIKQAIRKSKTLIWNGPLGAFELKPFDKATTAVMRYTAQRTQQGHLISVAGGGDTTAALNHADIIDKFTYVSTGGGAFLEWLSGRDMPSIQALKNYDAYNK